MKRLSGFASGPAIAMVVFAVAFCGTVIAGPAAGGHPADAAKGPWTSVVRDTDGTVLKATGLGEGRVPVSISVTSHRLDGRPGSATTYVRGGETLQVERVFDPEHGMSLSFKTNRETWQLSIALDPFTGEGQALYTLGPKSFALWVNENGQVLGGDLDGLREVLFSRSPIANLMRHYVKDRKSLGNDVPISGELAIVFNWRDQERCRDECSMGCTLQCAYECTGGPIVCQICMTACGLGCAIGCGS